MRLLGIVVTNPDGDGLPGVSNIPEPGLVETFVPELAVVGFAECVLGRLAGRHVMPVEHSLLRPGQYNVGDELRATAHREGGFRSCGWRSLLVAVAE